jgi:hypothetical protein
MNSYTKLFSSILTSTVWCAPHTTRIVWITMLALADKNGEVLGTVPGLARMANVTIPECESALAAFIAPDTYSRSPDEEGRRIEQIKDGWALINHAKYRQMASRDEQKTAAALRQKRWRDRNATSVTRNAALSPNNATVTQTLHIAEAEAEADTELRTITAPLSGSAEVSAPPSSPKGKAVRKTETDAEWLAGLAVNPTFAGIDVSREHGKCAVWCQTNRQTLSRKRFVNWLNRCDRPMAGSATPRGQLASDTGVDELQKRYGANF